MYKTEKNTILILCASIARRRKGACFVLLTLWAKIASYDDHE